MAQALGLALTPWGVLEAGILTGKPASERRWPEETASDTATRVLAVLRRSPRSTRRRPRRSRSRGCCGVARRADDRPDHRAPGARSRSSTTSARSPSSWMLTTSPGSTPSGRPQLGFPRGFLESSDVRGLIYGNTFEKLRA